MATVRHKMSTFPLSQIANADQCGLSKEIHSNRSLSYMGEKKTVKLVQNVSATTHSVTLLPLIFASGALGPLLYVVVGEPKGVFPQKGHVECRNLVVRAAKSHIMTLNSMVDWIENCVAIPENPSDLHLVLDSWPGFRNHDLIQKKVPNGSTISITNIPPHATGLIQPLDLHFNGPMKAMVSIYSNPRLTTVFLFSRSYRTLSFQTREFTSYALIHGLSFVCSQRDNLLKIISVVFHQMGAPFFQPFLQYSWYKGGYLDTYNPFLTPKQKCFSPDVATFPCEYGGCSNLSSFMQCARCDSFLCFQHTVGNMDKNKVVIPHHLC